ncbi:MAG TPA: BBP7 family outer membrane beta-barrel protein, partial [Urbifossiella sp.]|nr:BBP7 family outer membrane beta-barrel protein [Urbifossiella sp.]
SAGTVTASTHTNFLGGDVHLRRNLWAGDAVRLDGVVGYRWLHLGDRMASSWDVFGAGTPPPFGARLMADDGVRTRNDFHGGLLGLAPTMNVGRFSVTGRLAVALGSTTSERDVTRTRVVVPGLANAGPLGLTPVTLRSVGAQDEGSEFAVAPEAGVKFGWRATDSLHVTAGYSFLYWSRVRRAQEHFDPTAFAANGTTDFWAQGLSLGLEWRY